MTYRELLELYKKGKLEEEERKKVESDIERQDAIGEYLFEQAEIPGFDDLGDPPDWETGQKSENDPEEERREKKFFQEINRQIRRAFLKMGITVGAIVLAAVLVILFVLPGAVSKLYYQPDKVIATSKDQVITRQMDLDLAVFTEMMFPGYYRDNVNVTDRGYGKYDFCITQNVVRNGQAHDISGKIERNRLTLYDTNQLRLMPGNEFDWFQRTSTTQSLREQDKQEQKDARKELEDLAGENDADITDVHIVHGATDRESMKEELSQLEDNKTYLAYVTLDQMMDYEKFYSFIEKQTGIYDTWCAVKTNDVEKDDEENGNYYFQTDNVGFYCDVPTYSTELNWDKKKYPMLSGVEIFQQNNYEKTVRRESYAKQHMVSMLRYMHDHPELYEMLTDDSTESFDSMADYVEKNGVKVYGFVVCGEKEDLQKLAKQSEVYLMDIKEM